MALVNEVGEINFQNCPNLTLKPNNPKVDALATLVHDILSYNNKLALSDLYNPNILAVTISLASELFDVYYGGRQVEAVKHKDIPKVIYELNVLVTALVFAHARLHNALSKLEAFFTSSEKMKRTLKEVEDRLGHFTLEEFEVLAMLYEVGSHVATFELANQKSLAAHFGFLSDGLSTQTYNDLVSWCIRGFKTAFERYNLAWEQYPEQLDLTRVQFIAPVDLERYVLAEIDTPKNFLVNTSTTKICLPFDQGSLTTLAKLSDALVNTFGKSQVDNMFSGMWPCILLVGMGANPYSMHLRPLTFLLNLYTLHDLGMLFTAICYHFYKNPPINAIAN